MSYWERPPPLPQRPRPNDDKRDGGERLDQHDIAPPHPSPRAEAERPPPLPSRPRSRLDFEGISGSLRDSWRQLRSGLVPEDAGDGLKPPALPPRPVSASAIPDRQRPVSPNTSHNTAQSDTCIRTTSSSPAAEQRKQRHERRASVRESRRRRDGHGPGGAATEELDQRFGELRVSPGRGAELRTSAHDPTSRDCDSDSTRPRESHAPVGSQTTPTPPPSKPQRTAASPPPKAPITAETACLNIPVSSPATWYSHRDAPDVYICTRCYDGHLRDTPFRHEFNSTYLDDGQPRACRFSTPRIQKHLLATAAETGSLRELLDHVKARALVPNCKGAAGARASEGIRWFIARDGAVPGLLICEACWEDFAVVSPLAPRFQPADYPQDESVTWACDMAVPFIRKELDRRAAVGDWTGFAAEAAARLGMPPCGREERVPRASRKWMRPRDTPGILACAACFCDHVVGSGEEGKWREAGDEAGLRYADECACALGQFSIGLAMSFAEDRNDYSLFWGALAEAARGPPCDPDGTRGATWYTLRESDPRDLYVCGLCVASIVEPMGMGGFFTRKAGVAPDAAPRCCLNPRFPRFATYLQKLLEGYFTQSTTALAAFAAEYAGLPVCRRDTLVQDAAWFGWPECTICPECHHEFVRGTALADSMPYRGGRWETSTMCKMYSPRMRTLYLESCASTPPDATALLAYSEHRTAVYTRTVMVADRIRLQQAMAVAEQQRLNGQSLFYTGLGNAHAGVVGNQGRTYGAAGVGYGFDNEWQLQGAMYGRKAMDAGASVASGAAMMHLRELEREWRMVE